MKYVNLVIDNRSDSTDSFYTYGCEDDSISVGSKVYVHFARGSRLREAYAVSFADEPEEDIRKRLKFIEKTDEDISLSREMVRTALWMRNRYLCRYIDALRCFTPAGEKSKRGQRKNPFENQKGEPGKVKELTYQQKTALDRVAAAIESNTHSRFLLYGVTGSGKTEVYIRAAQKALAENKTAIILVPEISLTAQIIDRFTGRFGSDIIAVLHSRLSAGERYDQWKKIKDGQVKIVIGARSAVFAPLENIGLIVVDEEHEATYKSDYTPKYDTAEVAIKRLQDRDNQGVLILGSATPSISTYMRAEEGIYEALRLTKRYNEVKMPEVSVVDMREELKAGNRSIISRELYNQMNSHLETGRQVILFLNRRGYSTFVSCRQCGYVAKCPQCGVSLTYHKSEGRAVCHYCGYSERLPEKCPECGSSYIKHFGTGTEKLEETVFEIFDKYVCDRIDMDTVKRKGELVKKLKAFKNGKTDILIGTQLIAKGLDFKNVGLAGIISADISLNIPDFRAAERTFQLVTQAAGRAGRGDIKGQVVIQTYSPEHYAVKFAAAQDYEGFYETERQLRRYMQYPPYSDIFQIVFSSETEREAKLGAELWYEKLKSLMSEEEAKNLFPPQQAYLNKIRDSYRYSMILKCPRGKRKEYSQMISLVKEQDKKKRKREYTAVVDINPYSFI